MYPASLPPLIPPNIASARCDSFLSLRVLHWHKDDKLAASFTLPSCILRRKRYSFEIALSLEMTVIVADLFIGMSVPDTYRIPKPSSHRAMTLKEVHLLPLAILGPLSNFFLFSTRNDREAFRRDPSGNISLLSRFLSTILAKTCTYMSQVATYCI